MTDISLTAPSAYDPQMLAITRQQKLAEMLSQMGAQEIPVSSAGGISAPISPMSVLAKGLSSFGGSYLAGQAENKAKDYENSKLSDALMARLAGSGIDPNTLSSATSTTPEQPGFFDRAANFLGMGGNQEKPAIAGPAAPANTPTAPIDAESTPTGTYILPPTPASAPQPKNDAEGTPTSSYMPSQQPASPNAAPVLPYLAKLDQQAKYYTAYTPTTLQGKIDQQTGLIGIQQTRKDYLANLPRYQALLAAAPPENRAQLQAAIDTNNTALLDKYEGTQLDKSTPQAVNKATEISADASGVPPNARRPGDRYYQMPDGTMNVVRGSDMSSPGAQADAIRVANAKAAGEAEARAKYAVPVQIGYTGSDGEEVQTAASWNPRTGQYIDASTQMPIVNPQNLRVIGNATGGARSQAAVSRVLTSAADATSGIENLSGLKAGSRSGIFANVANTPFGALTRTVTTQEARDMQITFAGLGRAMGGLATNGMAVDKDVQDSYSNLMPKAGDSQITAMRQMAELKQQSTNALDVQAKSPILTNEQKKYAAGLSARIKAAIPWSVADVQQLQSSGNSALSLRDIGVQKTNTGGQAGGAAAPGAGGNATPTISSAADYNALAKGTTYIDPQGHTRTKP